MAEVLVIDDDQLTCEALCELVRTIGHSADFALTGAAGQTKALAKDYDVVFLDIRLPDTNGLDLLPALRQGSMPPEVIILTGLGDPDGAELAIRNGAWDYLQKPLSPKKILLPLQRVLKYRDTLHESVRLPDTFDRCGIVGESRVMVRTLERLAAAARSDAGVLITGETGTGKELFAKALHANSPRAAGPFVVVDCASIPSTLLESTLFGHVKGAYTGADQASEGLARKADGGTLFLDEVGEMPLVLQKKLLRLLQERRYHPVGGDVEVKSDFRLVAATHRDLERMVEDGQFRRDLLYRLEAMSIELPPLRERKEDLPELIEHIVRTWCGRYGMPVKTVSPDFLEALQRYDWPGNVRELGNVLESSMAGAYGRQDLFAHDLPERLRIRMLRDSISQNAAERPVPPEGGGSCPPDSAEGLPLPYKEFRREVLAMAERRYFARLMEVSGWDVSRACELSGLGKSRLYAQLKRYGVNEKD